MDEMRVEMAKFQDVDKAKAEASEKVVRLQKEKKLWDEKLKHVAELRRGIQADRDKLEVKFYKLNQRLGRS